MVAYDHHAVRIFVMPAFTLIIGVLFLAALAGLVLGIPRWRKPVAKVAVIASTLVLLLLALATVLVLITVWSGSMG